MNLLLLKHFGELFFGGNLPPDSWHMDTMAAFRNQLPWSSHELDENAEPARTELYEAFTYKHASFSTSTTPNTDNLRDSNCGRPVTALKGHVYAAFCKSDFTGSESPPDRLNQGLRIGLLYDAIQSITASCTVKPEKVIRSTGWGSHLLARRYRMRPRNGVVIQIQFHESARGTRNGF